MRLTDYERGMVKRMAFGTLILGSIGYAAANCRPQDNGLTARDFAAMEWCDSRGPVWNDYMKLEIPHNEANWNLYLDVFRKRNKQVNDINQITGTVSVPCTRADIASDTSSAQ